MVQSFTKVCRYEAATRAIDAFDAAAEINPNA
jgi:hypothetical protein